MHAYTFRLFAFVIILMPFISPTGLSVDWINVSSDMLKTAWGVGGVLLVFLSWVFHGYTNKSLLIYKTNLFLPIVGFIVWCSISLIWVENGFEATIMLAQYYSFALAFLLTINIFYKYDLVKAILKLLVISMFIVSVIGLLQYYLPNNNFIQNFFTQVAIPGSSFGNKNFASHFVVMVLPISLINLLDSGKNKNIIFYSITTFIGSWFIMYTYARQAYLAVSIEILLLLLFFILDNYKNNRDSFIRKIDLKINKVTAIILIIIALIAASNFNVKNWGDAKSSKIDRFGQISLEGGSIRIPGWINTFEMIKDNPLQGVGIGQWSTKYPIYYDRIEKDTLFNDNNRFVRLHNEYIEMLANAGIVGYVFLLWLVFLIIKKILLILSNPKGGNRSTVLALSLGLLGFSIVAMFSFPIRVYLPAFLVMVFVGMIFTSQPRQLNYLKINIDKYYGYFLGFIFLLVVYVNYQIFNWVMAENNYHKAVMFEKIGNNEISVNYGLKALSYNHNNPKYNNITGNNLIKSNRPKESIQFYKKSINISPFNTIALLNLALAYEKVNDLNMEHDVLNSILKFDSNNARASARLVKVLVKKQQPKNAEIAYKNMKDNFEYFKDRPGFGPYNSKVAEIALYVSDYEYAKYVYEDSIKKIPTAEKFAVLASIEYHYLDNKSVGIKWYKKALKMKPDISNNREILDLIREYESSVR